MAACGSLKEESSPVALVNGEEMTKEEFDTYYEEVKHYYLMYCVDLESEEMKGYSDEINNQIIEELVNRKLLLQFAEKESVKIREAEIQESIENIKSQFENEEVFQQELSAFNLTEEELKEDIEETLIIQEYVVSRAEKGELDVCEEEIESLYDHYSSAQDMLEYQEIRPALLEELEHQKEQELTTRLIDEHRQESDIEILL